MRSELVLRDGRRLSVRPEAASHWYVVDRPGPRLRDTVLLDGLRREVVAVARLEEGVLGVQLLPDFRHPWCEPCGRVPEPPTPEVCREGCGPRPVP